MTLKSVGDTLWLSADPLQRLRLRPNNDAAATMWPRTERKLVSLLLQAIPPELKSEVVAVRKMQVAQILFALYIKYQPGGQGERINLIKYLTDIKATGSLAEVTQNVRHRRRWWSRAEELGVFYLTQWFWLGCWSRFLTIRPSLVRRRHTASHSAGSCRWILARVWTR